MLIEPPDCDVKFAPEIDADAVAEKVAPGPLTTKVDPAAKFRSPVMLPTPVRFKVRPAFNVSAELVVRFRI